MKNLWTTIFVIVLTFALSGCSTGSAEETTVSPGAAAAPTADVPKSAATAAAPATGAPKSVPTAVAPKVPRTFEVPEGSEVTVVLTDSISTGKNKGGDQFMASLAEPIVVNGETVVERGAKIRGLVADAEGSGRVKGTANIRLILTSIIAGQKTYPIVTKPYYAESAATKGRDAGIIGGAAGIGAAIGAIAGGKGGAGKGAIIGGAAGTGTVLATKGKEVEFDSETKLKFMLEKSASLPKIRGKAS